MPQLSLFIALPIIYMIGAGLARWSKDDRWRWRIGEAASALNLLIALSALGASLLQAARGQAIDSLALCMALLIALLGWVIVRYSRRYLAGEEHQERYAGAMLFTLAAVSVVVITQNFAALVAGWIASSLGLHQLLIFFRERAAAQIVAHKKFLASRLAETCLVAAAALLFIELNTLSLPAMKTELSNALQLSWPVQIAALLIALGVILKSAQLPVHGWLIQVMEAPTPVSALLHAGIVNLGGFALIRLAALISAVPAAQILLVLVGGLTAVLAGLVMMTRISIKVRLAWSTCAQMGFMLMECGLGLYDLALLHLLAHSLYKAYAFLSAGDTVLDYRRRRLLPLEVAHPRSAWPQWLAAPASLLLVLLSQATWREFGVHLELASAAQLILAIGLAPLLWLPAQRLLHGSVAVIGLVQLYFGWHLLFGALVAQPAVATPLSLTIWICGLFSAFFTVQVWLRAHPHGRLAQLLYPWVYSGFYLDERFTRLTFQLWPARIERKASARELHPASHNPYPVSHHPFGGESA